MKQSEGNSGIELIQCINPRQNKWCIRWNVQSKNDANNKDAVTFLEYEFNHKPELDEIKSIILDWYNEKIDQEILSGMVYDNAVVWLSSENQFNYKAAYDLAIQKNGATLPVTFKFGTTDKPVYKQFNSISQLEDFYIKSVSYINQTLFNGWVEKDNIDWSKYEL
jgi:hypothetical protein